VIFIPLTVVTVSVTAVLKEPLLGWRSIYEGRLKSSWTDGSAALLCRLLQNSGALPPVHEIFKRPSYKELKLNSSNFFVAFPPLIPWSRVLLKKLLVTQPRNSPPFMETEGSLTVFTTARHWSLS
jgi:hypothetical protein